MNRWTPILLAALLPGALAVAQTPQQGAAPAEKPPNPPKPIDAGRASRGKAVYERNCISCQTIVPIYRNHVIAQVKPATRTRIDFGFALGDTKANGRLIDTGGFAKKDRITHRIPITAPEDIDAEVRKWLKVAYDRDA